MCRCIVNVAGQIQRAVFVLVNPQKRSEAGHYSGLAAPTQIYAVSHYFTASNKNTLADFWQLACHQCWGHGLKNFPNRFAGQNRCFNRIAALVKLRA